MVMAFMNRGGISAIVATVLIILVTIAGVAVIWAAVIPMIRDSLEFSSLSGRVSVLSSGGWTVYDAEKKIATVQVKREVDEGVMNRIRVSFSVDGNSVSSSVIAPGSGQTKVYAFDLSSYGVPDSVGVSPIFVAKSGKEKEGSVTSDVDLSTGRIGEDSSVAMDIYDMGKDYFYDASKLSSDGLVSWWKFDGGFNDSIGDNDGVQGVGSDASVSGDVLNLDGNDYVETGFNGPSLAEIAGDKLTISAWIKPSILSGSQTIMTKNGPFHFRLGENKLSVGIYSGSWTTVVGIIPLDLSWNHVTMVYDGVNIKLYVNGKFDNSISKTGSLAGSGCAQIGRSNDGNCGGSPSIYFNGEIDNLMIFKRAFSEEEVKILYDVQKK